MSWVCSILDSIRSKRLITSKPPPTSTVSTVITRAVGSRAVKPREVIVVSSFGVGTCILHGFPPFANSEARNGGVHVLRCLLVFAVHAPAMLARTRDGPRQVRARRLFGLGEGGFEIHRGILPHEAVNATVIAAHPFVSVPELVAVAVPVGF